MGLSKPIIITSSAVDTSNLATKSDMTSLQNTLSSGLANMGGMKIKSIQKGRSACGSRTSATISAVDLDKSMAFIPSTNGGGGYAIKNGGADSWATNSVGLCGIAFASSTLLTINHSSGSSSNYLDWVVIEFE